MPKPKESSHFITECSQRIDIVFAIDASSSIGQQNFERVVDFVRDVIMGLRIGTSDTSTPSRVGVLTYADNVEILFHLNVIHFFLSFLY